MVQHPLIDRPLIVEALPLVLQARVLYQFGDTPPPFHPFPNPIENLFENAQDVTPQVRSQGSDFGMDDEIGIVDENDTTLATSGTESMDSRLEYDANHSEGGNINLLEGVCGFWKKNQRKLPN